MKKLLLPVLLLAAGTMVGAARGTTVTAGGTEYQVDTLFHAKVGPGTTQTSLHLYGPHNLFIYYVTVDQTTPGVSIRTLSGADKVAGTTRPSVMAKNHSKDGLHYFAGSNGDFYYTGGTASNGSSIVGTPINAFASDREMFRTSNQWYQFSVDMEGVARICRLNFQQGTVTHGDRTVPFRVINNDASNNCVSLYTSKFWGSANQGSQADNCSQVTARLVEGDNFWAGCSYRLEVTSEPTRTGDLAVPADGFVIHGRGTAEDFVAALKPGDIVTFDNVTLTPEGDRIVPSCIVSGNPKNIGGGVNLNSEGERGDADQRHPRTGIGVSADGTKIVMMVVDGRGASVGCTTGCLGDMLLYAGCAEGLNLDGGGSSTLYTEALGVRNTCSDGQERAVTNAVYAVLEAPEDNEVAELVFYDYNPMLPRLGVYTPRVMALNRSGLVIDNDFKDYTLSCSEELGSLSPDGKTITFYGTGMHALTASYGEVSVSMPVTIDGSAPAALDVNNVVIDDTHTYTIGLTATVNGTTMRLEPGALTWTSADENIATVSADGVVTAVSDGITTIIGRNEMSELELTVNVENHKAVTSPLLDTSTLDSWRQTKTDIKDVTVTPAGDGFGVDFTISLARSPRLTFTPATFSTFGVPEAFDVAVDPGNTIISKMSFTCTANDRDGNVTLTLDELPAGEPFVARFMMDDFFGEGSLIQFPLTVKNMVFYFSNEKDAVCHFDVLSMKQNYNVADGVTTIVADKAAIEAVTVIDGKAWLATPADEIIVTDLAGRVLATGSGDCVALPDGHGIAIIIADGTAAKLSY